MADPVNLSLCMIVRDSARTLPACLQSICQWVDEMIVVDTGSVDDTPTIAQGFGAHVHYFPWVDDFAIARNESLRLAKGRWIFWMDSDDTISPENGERLRDVARGDHSAQTLGFVMQVHCPGARNSSEVTVVDHIKMLRNQPSIRFEGRIHEQVLPSVRRLGGEVAWTDIYVTHSGSDSSPVGRKRKFDRDLRLLKLDLADRPNHPFVLFNLGMTYNDMQQHLDAVYWLRRCLAFSLPPESHVRKAYALLIQSLVEVRAVSSAMVLAEQGLKLFPDDAELWFRKGMLSQHAGDLEEAILGYSMALRGESERRFSSRDPGIVSYKARHNLAICYSAAGKHDLAERQWRLAISDKPDHREAWGGLRRELIGRKKHASLSIAIPSLSSMRELSAECACWQASERIAAGQRDKAKALLQPFTDPTGLFDIDAAHIFCQILFEEGEFEKGAAILERILCDYPDDAASHYNLGLALSKIGQLERAREHLSYSLKIRPEFPATMVALRAVSP